MSRQKIRPLKSAMMIAISFVLLASVCRASDWPQLQGNPQRTGYTSDTVTPPFKVAWQHVFLPELISPFVQAVIYRDQVFVGTETGNLYALDAKDGTNHWKFTCGAPILHTAACGDGQVVVGALNGVYAVDATSGKLTWKFTGNPLYGFSSAPLISDETVFIGQRNGVFYALNLADGHKRWEYNAGAPIFNSAAFDAGQVFFCDEQLYLHCLNATTGQETWKSEQLYGQSAKGYCPVIVNGLVIVRPMGNFPSGQCKNYWTAEVIKDLSNTPTAEMQRDMLPPKFMDAQDQLVQYFAKWPGRQDLFILQEKTGKQAYIAPHFPNIMSLPGGPGAPAWDGKHSIILPWSFGAFPAYWGRFDLDRQRFVEILPPSPVGGNPDETVNVSVGGHLLYIMHCEEMNCQYTGIYNLDKKQCINLPPAGRKWEFSAITENGNNAASIANGYFYHLAFHSLAAWTSAAGAGTP